MKKTLLFCFILLTLSNYFHTQTTLKKKEVSEILKIISIDVDSKNLEKALSTFYSTENIILIENVKKKDLEKFNQIKKKLDLTKIEFETQKNKLIEIENAYYSLNFDKAFELFDLNLTNENSYLETQKTKSTLISNFEKARSSCEKNKLNLVIWEENYRNYEYEKLYKILNIQNTLENCFFKTDIDKLIKLQQKLKPKYEIYNSVYDSAIVFPKKIVEKNKHRDNKVDYYDSLDFWFSCYDRLREKLEGKNPVILKLIDDMESEVISELHDLFIISENSQSRIFSEKDKLSFLTNNTKSLDIDDIFSNFQKLDQQLLRADSWDSIPKFESAMNLDVLNYFDLNKKYDSDLKWSVFLNSPEYDTLFKRLNIIKSKLLNDFYYIKLINQKKLDNYINEEEYNWDDENGDEKVNNFFHKYDLKNRGFFIYFDDFSDFECSNSTLPKVKNNLEFKTIPLTKTNVSSVSWTKHFYEYYFFSISKELGLEIENARDNLEILLIFQIKEIEERKNLVGNSYLTSTSHPCSKLTKVVPTKGLRVIVYNTKSHKIYFDKVHL